MVDVKCGVFAPQIIITKAALDRFCTLGDETLWETDYAFHRDVSCLKPEAYQELKVVWVTVSHGNQGDMAVRKDKVDTSLPFQYVIGLYDTKRERAVQVHSNGVFQHMGECLQAIQNRIEQGFYWEKKI